MARFAPLLFVLLLVSVGLATRGFRLAAMERFLEAETYDPGYYLPRAELLPAVSLNYREAAAAIIWTRTTVYVGEELGNRRGADDLPRYIDAITTLDPQFCVAYDRGVMMVSLRAVEATLEQLYLALGIAREGYEQCTSGKSAWRLAAHLLYRFIPAMGIEGLEEYEGTTMDEYRREAEVAMAYAVRHGATPEWQSVTNAIHLQELGEDQLAVEQLRQMYAMADDAETRDEIAILLRQASRDAFVTEVEAERESSLATWREEFPWVDYDLFLVVGSADAVLSLDDEEALDVEAPAPE